MAIGIVYLTITDANGVDHDMPFVSSTGLLSGKLSPLSWPAPGSTGLSFSANQPSLPNIGEPFGGTGPYADYVLITTVPAVVLPALRSKIEIRNNSDAQIAVIRDDGTAGANQPPTNAAVFPLAGALSDGSSGESWSSTTFQGRLQVYALSSAAQVAVMVD